VSWSQALAWNRRTCRPGSGGQVTGVILPWPREGGPQAAGTAGGGVPGRGTGAGWLVVAVTVV